MSLQAQLSLPESTAPADEWLAFATELDSDFPDLARSVRMSLSEAQEEKEKRKEFQREAGATILGGWHELFTTSLRFFDHGLLKDAVLKKAKGDKRALAEAVALAKEDPRCFLHMQNLTSLKLEEFEEDLSSFELLTQFPRLGSLTLEHFEYADCYPGEPGMHIALDAFPELPRLKTLEFSGINISDLGPLARLTSLRELTIQAAPEFYDVSPLTALPHLTSLDVSKTNLGALDGIAELSGLKTLSLDLTDAWDCAGPTSVAPLKSLTNLTRLELLNRGLLDLEALADLPLKVLDLTGSDYSEESLQIIKERNPDLRVDIY